MKLTIFLGSILFLFAINNAEARRGPRYYHWGSSISGCTYCYEYTSSGMILNDGAPVSDRKCKTQVGSRYSWGRAVDGTNHCYEYTPTGSVLNCGRPVAKRKCY